MAKIALYRKYRPENLDQTIGQHHVITVLKNAILEKNFSHAYLFTGPRGTGKTSVARILAKAINCAKPDGHNPCGKCSICEGISEGRVLDLIEIDAASNRGIDEIRDLREKAKFSPSECQYKVFIIDEVHMLTKEAFNALLKTLEEPPAHAIFILATTEINKVPATILSRCQRHDFRRIKNSDIVARLSDIKEAEGIKISDDALKIVAETSEGGLRDAISLLDQLSSTGLKSIESKDVEEILGLAPHKMVLDFVSGILNGDQKGALDVVEKTAAAGTDLTVFAKSAQDMVRKALIFKMGAEELLEGTAEQVEEIKNLSNSTDQDRLVRFMDGIFSAQNNFKTSIDPRAIMTLVCAQSYTTTQAESVSKSPEVPKKPASSPRAADSKMIPNGKWQHVLMEVKQKNNAIHAVLRVAHPEFEDSVLILNFPYKFHKERVEERKTKNMLEEIASKVYGQSIEIKCQLNDFGGNGKVETVSDAANLLGGELVN